MLEKDGVYLELELINSTNIILNGREDNIEKQYLRVYKSGKRSLMIYQRTESLNSSLGIKETHSISVPQHLIFIYVFVRVCILIVLANICFIYYLLSSAQKTVKEIIRPLKLSVPVENTKKIVLKMSEKCVFKINFYIEL